MMKSGTTQVQDAPHPSPDPLPQGRGESAVAATGAVANDFANAIVHADCLDVLRDMPSDSIDLCYADPPFNTGRVLNADAAAYDDRWDDLDAYLAFMRVRLEEVARVLKPHGSILLHCDWRTCHHFRLMLEDILGRESFVNHLIWSYGLGGSSPRRFARKHDDILFHAKGPEYYFDPPRVPATSVRMRGQSKKATDVLDVPSINNMANERNGYPTQKPLALLEMLVQACCPPEGIVLDPFCGSGTTLVAAAKLGRRYIGIDSSEDAVRIARDRSANLCTLNDMRVLE
jgi:site-specific DNA-methyltransferase (adenine-specific)